MNQNCVKTIVFCNNLEHIWKTHYIDNYCQNRMWYARGYFHNCPVSSTNKTDRHNITEILLKLALNTITLTPRPY